MSKSQTLVNHISALIDARIAARESNTVEDELNRINVEREFVEYLDYLEQEPKCPSN